MIKCYYDRKAHYLHIGGHAGGKYGEDLVCAAVSTLVQALKANIDQTPDLWESTAAELSSGEAWLSIQPKRGFEYEAYRLMDIIWEGLMWVQGEYPDKVTCTAE